MSRDKTAANVPFGEDDSASPGRPRQQRLVLSRRDTDAFVKALLNPQPVNARLRETVRRYREIMSI